ncbi:MAG: class I SAM-dependent methyltransferase [Geminicoccaceae bacterium]
MKAIAHCHRGLVFSRRVRVLSALVADLLPVSGTILDVGCGDGSIASLIQERRRDLKIVGLDVFARSDAKIPVQVFDGTTVPYPEDSFDVAMFVDVLHHTDHAERLLQEGCRVARQGLIVKDHTREGILPGLTLRAMDWLGNRPHGVPLPYNYWSEREWRHAFRRTGLTPSIWLSDIPLYPWPANLVFGRSLHFLAQLQPMVGTGSDREALGRSIC